MDCRRTFFAMALLFTLAALPLAFTAARAAFTAFTLAVARAYAWAAWDFNITLWILRRTHKYVRTGYPTTYSSNRPTAMAPGTTWSSAKHS